MVKNIDPSAAHVFIVPHPDDWQLFMGEYAFDAIASAGTKVVIISTDAGDSGKDPAYWQAREKAELASIRSVLGFSQKDGDKSEVADERDFAGHKISHRQIRNVSIYFLRLPDGDIGGEGFPRNQSQSLLKFYYHDIDQIESVDKKNTYGRDDFDQMLKSLLKTELSLVSAKTFFHIQDPGLEKRFSHSDHLVTQFLARSAISSLNLANCVVRSFEDYRIKTKTPNLNHDALNKKMQLFTAYESIMLSEQQVCSLCDRSHYEWLSRSYVREYDCSDA